MKQIEIERKYIIAKPAASDYESVSDYSSSRIEQIYLPSERDETLRIRKREYKNRTEYVKTHKKRIDTISCIECEDEISREEYEALSGGILRGTRPIVKIRHTFSYGGQLFEIDEYPEWERSCIMETELKDREDAPSFPDFIRVIKEVSGERDYSNASMSRAFPKELA